MRVACCETRLNVIKVENGIDNKLTKNWKSVIDQNKHLSALPQRQLTMSVDINLKNEIKEAHLILD